MPKVETEAKQVFDMFPLIPLPIKEAINIVEAGKKVSYNVSINSTSYKRSDLILTATLAVLLWLFPLIPLPIKEAIA